MSGMTRGSFLARAPFVLAGTSVAGSLFLQACGSGSGSGESAATATVAASATLGPAASIGFRSSTSLPYMDVVQGFDPPSYNVLRNGVEPLLSLDAGGKLGPWLATSFKQVDTTTFVYDLRDDVTFWDGSKMTAEDVVYSIERSAGKTSLVNYYWASLKSAEQTGPSQVTIKISQPTAFQPFIPAYAGLLVVSKAYGEKHGSKFGAPGVGTMGTGPYVIPPGWNPDEGITITANPNYWNAEAKPLVKKIVVSVVTDASAALNAAQAGTLQAELDPDPSDTRQLANVGIKAFNAPGLAMVFFGFNVEMAPFDDLHVRRAFAHCVDRTGLANGPFRGALEVANWMTPPIQWAGMQTPAQAIAAGNTSMQYPFDIAAAKAELAKSAHPNGFAVELPVPARPFVLGVAQSTAANLKKIGITMTIKQISTDEYTDNQSNHDVPIQLVRYTADNNDPLNQQYYISFGKYAAKGQTNFANYKSAQMDALLEKYDTLPIGPEKLKTAIAVNKLLQEDLPYFTVGWVTSTMLLAKGFGLKRWDGYVDTFGPLMNLVGQSGS